MSLLKPNKRNSQKKIAKIKQDVGKEDTLKYPVDPKVARRKSSRLFTRTLERDKEEKNDTSAPSRTKIKKTISSSTKEEDALPQKKEKLSRRKSVGNIMRSTIGSTPEKKIERRKSLIFDTDTITRNVDGKDVSVVVEKKDKTKKGSTSPAKNHKEKRKSHRRLEKFSKKEEEEKKKVDDEIKRRLVELEKREEDLKRKEEELKKKRGRSKKKRKNWKKKGKI